MLEWGKIEICPYEYVPVFNRKGELEESLEYKGVKKSYRAIHSAQELTTRGLQHPTLIHLKYYVSQICF